MIDTIKLILTDYFRSLGYYITENNDISFVAIWFSHNYVGTMRFCDDSIGFSGHATNYHYMYIHYYDPNLIETLTRLTKESMPANWCANRKSALQTITPPYCKLEL